LAEAKARRDEVIDFLKDEPFRLIQETLLEINRHWAAWALDWNWKFRPEAFKWRVIIEEDINRKATAGNTEGMREAVSQYDLPPENHSRG